MTDEYKSISLQKIVDLAQNSCSELGATGINYMIDYITGKPFEAPDYDTAIFLASAREIVLELVRRLNELENPYGHLSNLQWQILEYAQSDYGTSIGTWEETKYRQACELVDAKLLNKVFDQINGRTYFFHISIKGRRALKSRIIENG